MLLVRSVDCTHHGPGRTNWPDPPHLTEPQPTFTSAVSTSFDAVTAHLDPGGNLYAFIGTRQWMEGISTKVGEWRSVIKDLPGQSPEDQLMIDNVFDLLTELIVRSGIEEVAGAGISGIAVEPDLYRTKLFIHRNGSSDQRRGIWTMFGDEPHELNELDFLPADTVWAAWSDFNPADVWNGLASTIGSSGIPELEQGFGQVGGMLQAMTGRPLGELLESLGGSMGGFITFSEENTLLFPVDGTTLEVPEPGMVIAFKVKDDTLFSLINDAIAANPEVIVRDEGDLRMRVLPVMLPVPMTLRATIARHRDYLFLASNDRLIDNLLAVQNGEMVGLKSTPEFERLSRGVPNTGNSFNYLSARFSKTLEEIQLKAMSSNLEAAGSPPGVEDFMTKVQSISGGASAYSVGGSTTDGWLTVSHGTQEPATAIMVPLVVAPTAVVAGLMLPALAKAKEKAARISCVNNMKQLGLGVLIHANDHNDQFPDEIKDMDAELLLTRPLICPLAPNFEDRDSFTWETLTPNDVSYDYLGKGMDSTAAPDTVIWRCHYHNNVGFADGSVHQLPEDE